VKEAKILESDDEGRGLRGRVPRRRARQEHSLRARLRLRGRAPRVLVAVRRRGHAATPRRQLSLRVRRPGFDARAVRPRGRARDAASRSRQATRRRAHHGQRPSRS
jgi:hypothetical protein